MQVILGWRRNATHTLHRLLGRYPDLMVHRLLKADMGWPDGYANRDTKTEF